MKNEKFNKRIKFIIKYLLFFLIFVMLNSNEIFAASAGDLNGDSKCSILDTDLLKKYLVQTENLTQEQKDSADINGDGIINITDLSLLKAKIKNNENSNNNDNNSTNDNNLNNSGNINSSVGKYEVLDEYVDRIRLLGIDITKYPSKTVYRYGESLNLSGLVIEKVWSDGRIEQVTDYIVGTFDTTKIGFQSIYITCTKEKKDGTETLHKMRIPIRVVDYIEDIEIVSIMEKCKYLRGELLDTKGLKVIAKYSSGKEVDITENIKINGFDTETVGFKKLELIYEDENINLNEKNQFKKEIEIEVYDVLFNSPIKTEYEEGEELDLSGGYVKILNADGSTTEIELLSDEIVVEGYDKDAIGTQTIKIKYLDFVWSYNVNVIEKVIEIEVILNKEIYKYGNSLDFIANKIEKDGTKVDITTLVTTNYDKNFIGTQTVEFKYIEEDEEAVISKDIVVIDYILDIEISSEMNKKEYTIGEMLDKTGLKVIAKYASGNEVDITERIIINGFDSTTKGTKKVEITFEEIITELNETNVFTEEIEVEIVDAIREIQVVSNKEEYLYGEYLDLTIKAIYMSGEEKDITSEFDFSQNPLTKLGTYEITIEYKQGISKKIQITVKDYVEDVEIDLSKTDYSIGEELQGLKVTEKYASGATKDVTEQAVVTGFDSSAEGVCQVLIKYGSYSKTIEVTIYAEVIEVSEIILDYTNKTMIEGTTEYITATVNPDNASNKSLKWNSSDTSVVTVNNNGKITAKNPGHATITVNAQLGTAVARCEIEVIEKSIEKVELNSEPDKTYYTYNVDTNLNLDGGSIKVIYDNGEYEIIDLTDDEITITGYNYKKAGTQKITVDYKGFKVSFDVFVEQPVSLDKDQIVIDMDDGAGTEEIRILGLEQYTDITISWRCSSGCIKVEKQDEQDIIFNIVGIEKGNAEIYFYVYVDGRENPITLSCDVEVKQNTNLRLNQNEVIIDAGDSFIVEVLGLPEHSAYSISFENVFTYLTINNVYDNSGNKVKNKFEIIGNVKEDVQLLIKVAAYGEEYTLGLRVVVNQYINLTLDNSYKNLNMRVGEKVTIPIDGVPQYYLSFDEGVVEVPSEISVNLGSDDGKFEITAEEATLETKKLKIYVMVNDEYFYFDINVNIEGLIPNEKTDEVLKNNTTVLQSWIDEASNNGGGTVTLPEGEFYFAKGGKRSNYEEEYVIKCKDNVKLVGAGTTARKNTTLIPYGYIDAGGRDMFYFNDYSESDGADAKYLINADFEDFIVDGGHMTGGSYNTSGKGFMINLCKDCDWENVIVKNTFATGFGMDCTVNCTITDCQAINCGWHADNMYLEPSKVGGASGFGIGTGYDNNEDITITNCRAEGNRKYGFFFEHQARFKTDFDMYKAESGDFVVSNCTASGNTFDFGGERAYDVLYKKCVSDGDYGISDSAFHFENVSVNVRLQNCSTELEYNDISSSDYFYDAVIWGTNNAIIEGDGEWNFHPSNDVTRSMAVQLLWRFAERPGKIVYGNTDALKDTQINTGFTDIKGSAPYATAVKWAVNQGITNGVSATEFSPDATCSKIVFLTFLYRYAGSPNVSVNDINSVFPDVPNDADYAKVVRWAYDNGIITGDIGGNFEPNVVCNKGMAITMLYRYAK